MTLHVKIARFAFWTYVYKITQASHNCNENILNLMYTLRQFFAIFSEQAGERHPQPWVHMLIYADDLLQKCRMCTSCIFRYSCSPLALILNFHSYPPLSHSSILYVNKNFHWYINIKPLGPRWCLRKPKQTLNRAFLRYRVPRVSG